MSFLRFLEASGRRPRLAAGRSELTHQHQRTAGNSGEKIVAFEFCLFQVRPSPAEHAEEENQTLSRQRSSAGRPRCRCETTEGCWDVASSTNDGSTGHRGGEVALCRVAFQSLTSCSPAEGITLATTVFTALRHPGESPRRHMCVHLNITAFT